jgi:hypothetical protein
MPQPSATDKAGGGSAGKVLRQSRRHHFCPIPADEDGDVVAGLLYGPPPLRLLSIGDAALLVGCRTMLAWGSNLAGQLGNGTTTRRIRPVPVLGLTGIIKVVAGNFFCLVLQ